MSALGDFTLLPQDDPQSAPDDDLNAAVAGALALPDVTTPITATPAMPMGRSWQFDWTIGQFTRAGQSPADTEPQFGGLIEWCEMAIHAARYAHPVFSDRFGMEKPESLIGEFAQGEALVDWQRSLVEALLVHDRITAVANVKLRWDPTVGVLYIDRLDIVTDEDQTVTVSDVTLIAGGA